MQDQIVKEKKKNSSVKKHLKGLLHLSYLCDI